MTPLAQLRNALLAFGALQFPESSEDETIGDLHADLAEYDGYVNGIARSLVDGEPAPRIGRDLRLRVAIEDAARDGPETTRNDARRLLNYLDRLAELVQKVLLVQSAQAERQRPGIHAAFEVVARSVETTFVLPMDTP